jgi:hypothetical protein
MLKKLLIALGVTGFVLSTCGPLVKAQQATPVQLPFSLTAAGQRLPTINLVGSMSSCSIVIYNSGGGFTLTPQAASDGVNNPTPTWVTATNINNGSITGSGSFTGQVSNSGLTSFGGILAALTSGTVSGVETCSNGIPASTVNISSLPPISGNVTITAPTNAAGQVIVTTPAPGATNPPVPMATASAGAVPTSAPLEQTLANCMFSNGLPAATAGNYLPLQCTVNGALDVAIPGFALPTPIPTLAPITPTATPLAPAPAAPVAAYMLAQCGTNGINWCPVASGNVAAGGSRNSLATMWCTGAGASCAVATAGPADATANATAVGPVQDFLMGFNGTTWDRTRKDTSANGPLWMTTGGSTTVSVPSNATTVVKGSAGRLVAVLITTLGAGTLVCFDNATTGTGTVIADFGASAAVGTIQTLNMPAANGITCVSSATGPVATVSFY